MARKIISLLTRKKAKISLDPSSKISKTVTSIIQPNSQLNLKANSSIIIGNNSKINSKIYINDNSELTIADDCFINNCSIEIRNNSKVTFSKGVIINPKTPNRIIVDRGTAHFGELVNFNGDLYIRFGGNFSIGYRSGVNNNTEIRCEERVEIGRFGLISYNVSIFDTDTHSIDYLKRREIITKGYPFGAREHERPNTSPIIIGDDVWIGKGVSIGKGVKLGDKCIVATSSTLGSGVYPENSSIVPAKPRVITR